MEIEAKSTEIRCFFSFEGLLNMLLTFGQYTGHEQQKEKSRNEWRRGANPCGEENDGQSRFCW